MAASDKSWLIKEVSVPVPWGVIACKAWGDPCATPMLVLHGIQDNAGSFDHLIPHLPKTFYYLCVDLPGHGRSSRMPKGIRLDFMEYVLSVDRVARHMKWTKFYIMGHSLGGQLSQYYAAMFPEKITKLISLDVHGPHTIPVNDYLSFIRISYEKVIELEEKMLDSNPPCYTYEMALQKMIDQRRSPITKEAAEVLVPRNVKEGKQGYYFSPDQRLKFHVMAPITLSQQHKNYEKILCPFLLIITKVLYKFIESQGSGRSFISTFEKSSNFQLVKVDGDHDVHNISPEVVAPHICKFLNENKSML